MRFVSQQMAVAERLSQIVYGEKQFQKGAGFQTKLEKDKTGHRHTGDHGSKSNWRIFIGNGCGSLPPF
jgi:hypothetical protein